MQGGMRSGRQRRGGERGGGGVRGLFVVVDVADELLFGEGSGAEEGEAGGQCAVGEAHGYGDGGKAGLGREYLGVVARWAGGVADLSGRVTPGGVDDGVDIITL